MKEFQKCILDNERVISTENIRRMGEVIALCCIKTVIAHSGKIAKSIRLFLCRSNLIYY